jgi:ribokinase
MVKPIVVVGSANADLVAECQRAPDAGETLYGRNFHAGVGGKGLNQAAACALQSAEDSSVSMIACIGTDDYGSMCEEAMVKLGIQTAHIVRTNEAATGVAMITVESSGDNRILYIPGANGLLSVLHVDNAASLLREAAVVVCQLESPMETVLHALDVAHQAGVRTLLNPAPVQTLPDDLYTKLSFLVPNESEAALLSGMPVETPEDAIRVGKHFLERGVQEAVIVTLGEQGSVLVTRAGSTHVASKKVKAIDTTAYVPSLHHNVLTYSAGDSFIGGICAKLAEGSNILEAVQFGTSVAAITVTRSGASDSIPTRAEVDASLS